MGSDVVPAPTAAPLIDASCPLVPKTTVWGAAHNVAAAPGTVPCMLQVLAAPVGVNVNATGTAVPSASFKVVVTVTGVVAPAGRFPPRSTCCVSAGGSADPTITLRGPGGDVLGC